MIADLPKFVRQVTDGLAGLLDLRRSVVEVPRDAEMPSLYPNPASGEVFFSGADSIRLFDMVGREVARGIDGRVDLSALAPGVYLARTSEGSKVVSRSVVVR